MPLRRLFLREKRGRGCCKIRRIVGMHPVHPLYSLIIGGCTRVQPYNLTEILDFDTLSPPP